jgi:hypothetical protein
MENATLQVKLLDFVLLPLSSLYETDIKRMYELMVECYDHMDHAIFLSDLSNKDYVGLLFDGDKVIQGFTTFGINPKQTGREEYSIIFSGDTIISPDHWGSQEMMRGWGISVGKIIATDTAKKWYWFLLSKGHRTYMYLPLFFNDYYPSIQEQANDDLKNIIEETASKLYPNYYNSATGLVVFDTTMGELKPALAKSTWEKQSKPHVKLFLERNPGFYKGDELVCMTQLHPDNMRGYGKKYILEGMEQNL